VVGYKLQTVIGKVSQILCSKTKSNKITKKNDDDYKKQQQQQQQQQQISMLKNLP